MQSSAKLPCWLQLEGILILQAAVEQTRLSAHPSETLRNSSTYGSNLYEHLINSDIATIRAGASNAENREVREKTFLFGAVM